MRKIVRRALVPATIGMFAALSANPAHAASDCANAVAVMVDRAIEGSSFHGVFVRAKDRGKTNHLSTADVSFQKTPGRHDRSIFATFEADFGSRTDTTTIRLIGTGQGTFRLDDWGYASFDIDFLRCDARFTGPTSERDDVRRNDIIMMTGRYVETNGVSHFTLALTEYGPPG